MESFGISKPMAYYEEWIGIPDTELCMHLEAEFPAWAGEGEFLSRKEEYFDRLIADGLAPFEGLAVLFHRLLTRCMPDRKKRKAILDKITLS